MLAQVIILFLFRFFREEIDYYETLILLLCFLTQQFIYLPLRRYYQLIMLRRYAYRLSISISASLLILIFLAASRSFHGLTAMIGFKFSSHAVFLLFNASAMNELLPPLRRLMHKDASI